MNSSISMPKIKVFDQFKFALLSQDKIQQKYPYPSPHYIYKYGDYILILFSIISCAKQKQFVILIRLMKKQNKKKSQLQIDSPDSQEEINKDYVEVQRKKKNKRKTEMIEENGESGQQEILDIHHGDKFVREHIRPAFLKRWDGESNTLELTQDQMENMSPMLKIYWEHKSKNMNCIIFVQIGRVQFFAFEDDAIKCHEIFKKKLKRFSNFLMVNFWSKEIQLAKVQLFQRRIPVLMLNELDDDKYREEHGIIKRQITQVITPSIHLTMEPKKFRERMMLAIYNEGNKCGVACVDVETNHFYLEQFEANQDDNIHEIRRIINKYRPAELLAQKKDQTIKKIAKQICQPYIIQLAPMPGQLINIMKQMKEVSQDEIFGRFLGLYNKETFNHQSQFSFYSIVKVLSLILQYMKNLALQAKIFGQGIFQICDFESAKLKPMFDAQVYENLQVFSLKDEEDSFGKPGTLYNYLNYCVTNSGQKLLKKWIDQPLRTLQQISKRQIAIQNLLEKKGQILLLQKQLLGFEKLERKVGNIYHWAIRKSQQGKALLTKQLRFDKDYDQKKNPAVIRIKQIYDVLKIFLEVEKFFQKMSQFQLQSQLLKKCSKIIDAGNLYKVQKKKLQQIKGLPSVSELALRLLNYIYIEESTAHIEPRSGINEIFDFQKQQINKINAELDNKLAEWKKKLGVTKISYVSVRARNQIEVPLSQVKNKKFPQLIFSSQTTKMIRYVTAKTTELSEQLIEHQEALATAYEPFSNMMVKQFCAHKHIWDLYINAIAKIDVLMSLAKTSSSMVPRCLPNFVKNQLFIKNGFHPGLLQVKKRQNVVGNTLKLEHAQKILLLTGPNMGGKSTLLRQTCLLAILAQIGCFVPCQKYQTIVFDQIFCRIGASDRIIQGKSTFYVELQQTKRVIDQATPNSLVIIDELGRGTSTYDGMALASSILKYITQQIQCYTLFSTHYFPLTHQYSMNSQVLCGKIGYSFDKQRKQIKFTYQLEKGVAEKSFANQVAAQVGVSEETLMIAQQKAQEIQIKNQQIISQVNDRDLLMEIKKLLKTK